jgi:hypothetical protein
MKSVIAVFLLLIYMDACNNKQSNESRLRGNSEQKAIQMQVQTETDKIQQKNDAWYQEPTSVFGIPFGASKQEVAKKFTLYGCRWSTVMEICQFNHKLSNVNLRCTIAFSSKSGMQHIRANFSKYHKQIVLSMLSKAYGPPHFTLPDSDDPAKTWGHDWRGKNVDVSFTNESFSITTKLFHKEVEETTKKQINSAAQEL